MGLFRNMQVFGVFFKTLIDNTFHHSQFTKMGQKVQHIMDIYSYQLHGRGLAEN